MPEMETIDIEDNNEAGSSKSIIEKKKENTKKRNLPW